MNTNITKLTQEAHEIIVNAKYAMMNEEISQDQYNEVIKAVLEDVGIQTEIISQPQ